MGRPTRLFGLAMLWSLLVASGLLAFQAAADERAVPADAAMVHLSFAPVVREVAPAVVNISAERESAGSALGPLADDPFFRRFFERFDGLPSPRRRSQTSLGSGVIVEGTGTVVTNHHVVAGADAVTVMLADRREFSAAILRSDEDLDLAVLQLDAGDEVLPAVAYGASDAVEVGDLVLAIGNPFGIGQSVSSGIVSATARSAGGLGLALPVVQTDAAINPGNSGGALVGMDGRLVGINTAILTRGGGSVGVGFAVPADVVRAYVEGRIAPSPAQRPWLGARLQEVDFALALSLGLDRPSGALVADVHPASAAADAGLVPGDVLLAVGDAPTDTMGDVGLRLALAGTDGAVPLSVWRRGSRVELSLAARAAPREPAPERTLLGREHPLAGLEVANLSPSLALDLDLDPFTRGVIVLGVVARSPAARLRLRAGDVLLEVDGRTVDDQGALREAVRGGVEGRRILIDRDGRRLQLVIG